MIYNADKHGKFHRLPLIFQLCMCIKGCGEYFGKKNSRIRGGGVLQMNNWTQNPYNFE